MDRPTKTPRRDWSKAPMVFITLPACPGCGSGDFTRNRSDANGDSSVTRYCICDACGLAFKVVAESSPDAGLYTESVS